MPSKDRAVITRDLYRHLANPGFRRCLSATAEDGTQPVVVALRDDSVGSMVKSVMGYGGASNVVIPWLNGFIVLACRMVSGDQKKPRKAPPVIEDDCTVGVFLARLQVDGVRHGEEVVYHFALKGPDHREAVGRAEVVAVAG